jgi:hypothetical protein
VLINGVGKFLRYSTLRQRVTDRDRQFCRLISKGEV